MPTSSATAMLLTSLFSSMAFSIFRFTGASCFTRFVAFAIVKPDSLSTMTDDSRSLDDRLTEEVAQLLTKLVTAVAKQLELEEKLLVIRRENARLKERQAALDGIETQYNELKTKLGAMQVDYDKNKKIKEEAEAENSRLSAEVEDLTASLFDEANKMVSDASRLTDNYKIKNGKLQEELHEKDVIIEDLQAQLLDLKQLFVRIEEEQKNKSQTGTPALEQTGFVSEDRWDEDESHRQQLLAAPIFAPKIEAVRFDLDQYQYEFKSFIYAVIRPTFTFDLTNLKALKYFKKIWTEELENSISHIPPIANSTFINRWQKGKNFWSLIVEGKAVIEPIKSVNETYKITYRGKTPKDAPVATRESCTFCGESRDDILEHARLYSLKLLAPELSSTSLTENEPVASYPLCTFCLIKLRNICDFFAKLRSIHSNIFKLKQNHLFEEYTAPLNFQFKRQSVDTDASDHLKERKEVVLEPEEEAKLIKLYIILTQIRSRIFWSKIGLWDHEGVVMESVIDEIPHDVFGYLGRKYEGEKAEPLRERRHVPERQETAEIEQATAIEEAKIEAPETEAPIEATAQSPVRTSIESTAPTQTTSTSVADRVHDMETQSKSDTKSSDSGHSQADASTNSEVDEFADANESQEAEPKPLSRRLSSKQRKKKISKDLNSTIQMLQESIE